MIIECTIEKTYDIDDYALEEYIEWISENGSEPNFFEFIEWYSDAYDLEDMQVDNYAKWDSINGVSDINTEFENIIKNYCND